MMQEYKRENHPQGKLYVVPTPIGNLYDITQRALSTLQSVDIIAAENTRHTCSLLRHFSINACLFPFHDHNERKKTKILVKRLQEGKNIALVSNAGTPLINDPGYHLVHSCREARIRVVPLPGPCAAIVALSASGLPSNRFCYEGFLPASPKFRQNLLKSLKIEPRTLIFYESTHRLLESLEDIIAIFGKSRHIVLARELTKIWEVIYGATGDKLLSWIREDKNRSKGEIVLVIEGYKRKDSTIPEKVLETFTLLQSELPIKKATLLTSKIHRVKKNLLYKHVLSQIKK